MKAFDYLIGKSLRDLTRDIDKLASGKLQIVVNENYKKRKSEIGLISRSIDQMIFNLKKSVHLAKMVSKGELYFEIEQLNPDGELDSALKDMVLKLREMSINIKLASEQVGAGSRELSSTAQAIAQGAIDAGVSGIYAYPGTPSTEITEYVQKSKEAKEKNIRSEWSANEKTAMESAIGMSYAGKRAMVCMKHVGLNVAADGFINSAITGANGGLVIVAADDPSMHSSQNEQDSRFYGKFAMIPILEPANQQEAYDMVSYGFEHSEKMKIPVLMRITTRLAHSRSGIERTKSIEQNSVKLPESSVSDSQPIIWISAAWASNSAQY